MLGDIDRTPETMITLEACLVRAAADKNSEALWALPEGEVIEMLHSVTVPATATAASTEQEEDGEEQASVRAHSLTPRTPSAT